MPITGAQVRAARAYLKWTVADLAKSADVGNSTIQDIEKIEPREIAGHWRISAREEALGKIERALVAAGITFLPANSQGNGIRGKAPPG
jgi:transcriptional regulator with XRE-family HTH domain